MRYNDWDVLLFPAGPESKTPFKEFKVACQVVADAELAHCQGSLGLPIVTCFVPSLQPGAPFQVSVHSWSEPDISQFTKSYSKHIELVQFEARVFIDGRLVASSIFSRKSKEWPHKIDTTFELTNSGELAMLKFPTFKKELIFENDWHAGDNTGRIKVVISEGFPRDSPTMPLERIKNVVAFSFQHAPLDVLEASGIAWPNPSMWRVPPLNSSLSLPSFRTDDDTQSHGHSPRRQSMLRDPQALQGFQNFPISSIPSASHPNANTFLATMGFPQVPPTLPRTATGGISTDSLNEMAYFDYINSLSAPFANDFTGKPMWPVPGSSRAAMFGINNNLTQTDFTQGTSCPPLEGEPMHLSGPSLEDDPMPITNLHTKVPTNTPTTGSTLDPHSTIASASYQLNSNNNSFITPDFAHSLTHSLLNQPLPIQPHNIPLPASEIKSRKERDSRFPTMHGSNPASAVSTPQGANPGIRKFSQPLFNAAPSIFGTTASTSPCSGAFTSATASRNASNTDLGSNLAPIGTGGTPIPLRNSSAASLNAGGLGSSRKRTRNYTPASSKAIDDEDQPLRPSPHMRASYGMEDDDSD